jgi:hypothetical protein
MCSSESCFVCGVLHTRATMPTVETNTTPAATSPQAAARRRYLGVPSTGSTRNGSG